MIRVTNWTKWTRFKKRVMVILFLLGMLIALGVENSDSIANGVIGIILLFLSAMVFNTIRESEW